MGFNQRASEPLGGLAFGERLKEKARKFAAGSFCPILHLGHVLSTSCDRVDIDSSVTVKLDSHLDSYASPVSAFMIAVHCPL